MSMDWWRGDGGLEQGIDHDDYDVNDTSDGMTNNVDNWSQ